MNCISSSTCTDGFNTEEIIWARRDYDGIYWPGKINFISYSAPETLSTNVNFSSQVCSYLVQFFGFNQTQWTIHILPYRQYRDYMVKTLVIHYESSPQMKYQFLNAIHHADYTQLNTETSNESKSLKSNGNHLPTSNSLLTTCRNPSIYSSNNSSMNYYSQSSNIYQQYLSNHSYNTQLSVGNYCSCCTQPTSSLSTNELIMTNPPSEVNSEYSQTQINPPNSENGTFQQTTSILIITTKSYANSSFISFLSNTFSNSPDHSIIYIDDNAQLTPHHPSTSNTYYLICFDHFDSTIQQQLDSTILNNLNAHINYLFVILNAPSNELVKHLYSNVIDRRSIVVVHYHTTFDNEPLLLCSGNRSTFEMSEKNILKYLCAKIQFIETQDNEQIYATHNIKTELINHCSDSATDLNTFTKHPDDCSPFSSSSSLLIKRSKDLIEQKIKKNLGKKSRKQKIKPDLSKEKLPKN